MWLKGFSYNKPAHWVLNLNCHFFNIYMLFGLFWNLLVASFFSGFSFISFNLFWYKLFGSPILLSFCCCFLVVLCFLCVHPSLDLRVVGVFFFYTVFFFFLGKHPSAHLYGPCYTQFSFTRSHFTQFSFSFHYWQLLFIKNNSLTQQCTKNQYLLTLLLMTFPFIR